MELHWERGLLSRLLLLIVGAPSVLPIDVRAGSAVYGVVGESVRLWCTFSSNYPLSDSVSITWTYRPEKGGSTITLMHYQAEAYPFPNDPFKDRVKWDGDARGGDASILLENLRLTDNGTLSCQVKNLPVDVHGNVPQTKLTVTLESLSFRFNTVLLLSALVFIPSAVVSLILLIRMRRAIKRDRLRHQKMQKSPIEDSQDCIYDENITTPLHRDSSVKQHDGCLMRLCRKCDDDSDDY
ncbi:myelin protein zero-like protein 3 [Pseudophryne corroboree]|uniref:myelin protein zero-like protein 3 n=1 Tax=Pseudophryne corroboree TaxID=495146 RepID=UPI003081BBA7